MQQEQDVHTHTNGWDGILGALGMNGMGDITGNLGYVMAMLPDVLLGAFTGKSQSLRPGDNLLPIASIVAGMFVRNPLLKMLLIGLGGVNLLNKAGHEALQKRTEDKLHGDYKKDAQYRRYADEPLNPRIVNPVLQGCTLVATIDRVPCTIQLSPTVADAYHTGRARTHWRTPFSPRATSSVKSRQGTMTTDSRKPSCAHGAYNKFMNIIRGII